MRIEIVNWRRFNPRTTLKSMPWMRLQTGISLERKLDALDADQRWLWIVLLDLHAAENTEAIDDVELSYLVTRSKVPADRCAAALAHFVAKGLCKIDAVPAAPTSNAKRGQRLTKMAICDTSATDLSQTCSTRVAPPFLVGSAVDSDDDVQTSAAPEQNGDLLHMCSTTLIGEAPRNKNSAAPPLASVDAVFLDTDTGPQTKTRTKRKKNVAAKPATPAKPDAGPTPAETALATLWLDHALLTMTWRAAPASWTVERFADDVCRIKAKYGVTDDGLRTVLVWAFADDFWHDKILSPDGVIRRKGASPMTKFDNVLIAYRRHLAPAERARLAAEAVANGTWADPWAGTEAER